MTIRNAVLGFALMFSVSVWAWCRPCGPQAQAQGVGTVVPADEESGGGNREEALARYRHNQSHHWRQVALGH
jgi:hypothetical protein